MAHLLTPAPATTATPISTRFTKNTHFPTFGFQRLSVLACHQGPDQALDDDDTLVHRRVVMLGLVGATLGLTVGDRSAIAAARRPPPPPPGEKKDPNVSGVLAKVLASKKRKEAMKESMAKLREKGKAIDEPSE
ncbi:uncharacterized protein LOC132302526 [Cornus florida]|uniref:uncharacterized protein LOC132302526 n=1 Tax=Cornus florida TaxID=4283 RepID=UPI0028A29FCB|nr:uncharacterized protein LOC132302526 [Cornus florida]